MPVPVAPLARRASDALWAFLDQVHLTSIDLFFALLRVASLAGGLAWVMLPGSPRPDVARLLPLLIVFGLYSLMIYGFVFWRPAWVRRVYRVAMLLDLAFISLLVLWSGEPESPFYLAYYLLVALHAFYYGLRTGLLAACAAALLYLAAHPGPTAPGAVRDLLLEIGFLFLIALGLGVISEKEKRERALLERLNEELREKGDTVRAAYARLESSRRQVLQSEKLASIGRLAAGVAHEINNPLDGIQNCIREIARHPADAGLRERYLTLVQEALGRIEAVVRHLLDYARGPRVELRRCEPNALLADALELLSFKVRAHGILVTCRLDARLREVRADPAGMQQVFVNLIINALDAMPEGGRLEIRSWRDGDGFWGVEIADTGCGIRPEDRDRIFDPFFTTKGPGQGTGLGLSTSLAIVEGHGGRIEVRSEPGRGSAFRVVAPAERRGTAG